MEYKKRGYTDIFRKLNNHKEKCLFARKTSTLAIFMGFVWTFFKEFSKKHCLFGYFENRTHRHKTSISIRNANRARANNNNHIHNKYASRQKVHGLVENFFVKFMS